MGIRCLQQGEKLPVGNLSKPQVKIHSVWAPAQEKMETVSGSDLLNWYLFGSRDDIS